MESNTGTHHVRKAVKDDCSQIMELIKALARFINLEDIVVTNVEVLTRDGFPDNKPPRFECIVSHDANNQLSGYLAYNYTYSTWDGPSILVLNLYIQPQYRKMRLALKMVSKLIKLAHSDNIGRIDFYIADWNKKTIDFHESLGAINLTLKDGLNVFMFDEDSIQSLANSPIESQKITHHVREAFKDDCRQIMELIKMFARSKDKESSVKIDAETLMRDGFNENERPKFKCIVSHDDNDQLSGYLIYCYTYSPYRGRSIHIEETFVAPQYKIMGIEKKMMIKLAEIASDDIVVYIDLYLANEDKSAIDLHCSLGAVFVPSYYVFRGDLDGIQRLAASLKDLCKN